MKLAIFEYISRYSKRCFKATWVLTFCGIILSPTNKKWKKKHGISSFTKMSKNVRWLLTCCKGISVLVRQPIFKNTLNYELLI